MCGPFSLQSAVLVGPPLGPLERGLCVARPLVGTWGYCNMCGTSQQGGNNKETHATWVTFSELAPILTRKPVSDRRTPSGSFPGHVFQKWRICREQTVCSGSHSHPHQGPVPIPSFVLPGPGVDSCFSGSRIWERVNGPPGTRVGAPQ